MMCHIAPQCAIYTDFAGFYVSPSCFGKPRWFGWLKSIRLEPRGRCGNILGVFLEQNYMRSLFGILVLLGKSYM